jgi:hypothetical protein
MTNCFFVLIICIQVVFIFQGLDFADSGFNADLKETRICPVVIMQKRSTIGNNWPDNYSEPYTFRPEAMGYMQDFLKTYQYRQVWENDFFRIYVPAEKTPAFAGNSLE